MILAVLLTGAFMNYELSKMYGGHTQLAQLKLEDKTPSYFALTNVNVLTPSADKFISDQTVLVDQGTILSVGANVEFADDTPTIDGQGMFLVPGYTDSHVHLWESENDLLLYVANGVTQIREMNGSKAHLRWKAQIQAGRLGPDMFVVAPQLATFGFFEGLFVGWTQNKVIVRTETQVNKAVQSLKDDGYDAVKSSSFLDKDSYTALSNAAANISIPLVGHIPMAVGSEEFLNSNQIELAHVEELMKALNREFGEYTSRNADSFLEFVRSRSDDVADRLLQEKKSVTSTLWLIDSFSRQKTNLGEVLRISELSYANPGITEGTVITSRGMGWLPDVNIYRWPDNLEEARRQRSIVYWKTYAEAQHIVFESLLKKGVPIMAGTDANVPVTVPGFSLHDEMITLNKAGMSPSQVLASVSSVPSKWMQTNTGEIRANFKANLVLLRDNPLEDIQATNSIEMVIVNGRILSRTDLDSILLAVQNANDASRTVQLEYE
ncbi:MAG: amidohydrolase [Robiginitomaculum sp.]|nr:MAG: amidohydrolase [Robiginitomaculum sp.]